MSKAPPQPKRKRRWLSYSLRSLFVVVTILCVALGYWTHRANRQKAVVKWVEENGGGVYYDFHVDEQGYLIDNLKPPGPKWVQKYLGKDYLATVIVVDLRGCEFIDITPLAQLDQLKNLSLGNTQQSDMTPLTQITRLEYLDLSGTQVSDLTPLLRLTSLHGLSLENTPVTQEQIDELKITLPNCKIVWSPVNKPTKGN